MHVIEPLEARIAPATGLTVRHLPGGALSITATDGDDFVYLRSDEPGWLTIGVAQGDLIVDNQVGQGQYTMPMPKGAITVKLLGGDDALAIGSWGYAGSQAFNPFDLSQITTGTLVIPGSLSVIDSFGTSQIGLNNVTVRGALSIGGNSADNNVLIEGRLGVGRDFNVDLGGGDSDRLANNFDTTEINIAGSFVFHSTATSAIVALGLDSTGNRVREVDNQLDVALELRDFRVGRGIRFEAAGQDARLLLGSAQLRVGGKISAMATGAGSLLGLHTIVNGPLSVTNGLYAETAGASVTIIDAQKVAIGGSIVVEGGAALDSFTIEAGSSMLLPRTTLTFRDGIGTGEFLGSDTTFRAGGKWTLAGPLKITAGSGDDRLTLAGAGRINGALNVDYGLGVGLVTIGGDGAGQFTLAGATKLNSLSELDVVMYTTTAVGRIDFIGHSGNDALLLDSIKAMSAVVFTGSAGNDRVYVDHNVGGRFTPSSFLGPVVIDMGDGADDVILGNSTATGWVGFAGPVTIKSAEGYTPDPIHLSFKKRPVIL